MPHPADNPNKLSHLGDIVSVASSEPHVRPIDARPERHPDGPYLRLHFCTLFVRDQQRSIHFFRDQLGFRLVSDVLFSSGLRWVEFAPPDGVASLALVTPLPGSPEEALIGASPPIALVTEDVDAKFREWQARGVPFLETPQAATWGGTLCRFQDPDGNRFSLAGFDQATREIEQHRRAAAARAEAELRSAQELTIAREVQSRLLPQRRPAIPGLDYAGVCHQARAIGGDYFDFLELGPTHTALVIGDIAGKGIAAALLMAHLQASLRSQAVQAAQNPGQALQTVNRAMLDNTADSSYTTLFFGDFDHRTGLLRYSNCGHLPPLLLRSDGSVHRLAPTSTVLGLFPTWHSAIAEVHLAPGDLLALYTDGVTEATAPVCLPKAPIQTPTHPSTESRTEPSGDLCGDTFGDKRGEDCGDERGKEFGDECGGERSEKFSDGCGDKRGEMFGDEYGNGCGEECGDRGGDERDEKFGDACDDACGEKFGDACGEEFGEDRLIQALRRHHHLPAQQLAEAVIADVLAFSARNQTDDITVVIAKLQPQPTP